MSLLKVHNLSKRFAGLQAVDDVSFSVDHNQVFGIIGPNGAGKSTTFNLIMGNVIPDQGQVIFDGNDVVGEKTHKITLKGLGRTFQDATLFPGASVLDNILTAKFGRIAPTFAGTLWRAYKTPGILQKEKEKAFEILRFVGLENYSDELASNLDHGHQGLVQLAIALATEPKLLMLDEPLRGMNPTEKEQVSDLIIKIKKTGISVLIIEHDVKSIMKICDRIAVINYGKKISEGSPLEIKSDKRVIEAYLGSDESA
ncbi:ABC transporter ATP-binding protein [Bacillus sp. MRMR6]|uniref:ABC transporter ATP-binding protein n=1 Tax=Bacillus sp. MRMR6 TaxID=1928617 RepID=UPI000950C881|nr:ABC transporter ATP-binding protein [Bacillus sp. MRMR6]OLS33765.1 hypothetical protein BTR25_24015 [Bacillus sp. MRMR6]